MLLDGDSISKIAESIPCTEHAVYRTQSTIRRFGTVTAPTNRVGPDPKITRLMRDALCRELVRKPDMLRREMVVFLYEQFEVEVSLKRITEALKAVK